MPRPDSPAPECGVGAVRRDARPGKAREIVVDRHIDLAIGPRDAGLAVDQRRRSDRQKADRRDVLQFIGRAHGVADAAGQRGDRLRAHPARGIDGLSGGGKAGGCPIRRDGVCIGLDPEHPSPSGRLPVEADLASGHEPGAPHPVAEHGGAEWVGKVGGRDREPGIRPEVESGPIPDDGSHHRDRLRDQHRRRACERERRWWDGKCRQWRRRLLNSVGGRGRAAEKFKLGRTGGRSKPDCRQCQ